MMPPKRGAPPRLGPTTDECDFAADLLQIASSLTLDAISDCNFAAREDDLAPPEGRGRKARAARHPGEGEMAAGCTRCEVAGRPLTPALSPHPRAIVRKISSAVGLRPCVRIVARGGRGSMVTGVHRSAVAQ